MNKKNKVENNQGTNFISIIAILVASAFVATFNETILNVALSAIMKDMNVSAGTVQWLITAYMTVAAVMVPITAFLIQSFKTRKLFLSAIGLLLIGTICAALSNSFAMLLISRMIQSAGTGMIIPIMMNTILLVAPKEKLEYQWQYVYQQFYLALHLVQQYQELYYNILVGIRYL